MEKAGARELGASDPERERRGLRRLIVIISVVACLSACAGPKTFDSATVYVAARTAAAVRRQPAISQHAVAVHSRDFHRWMLHLWFAKWLTAMADLERSARFACGGDLPPCFVMWRESGGDIRAENPVSTASGKWQFLDSTWNGYGGYAHAAWAPALVQNAKAREVWSGGSGCSHWSAC